jgi:hypothetical protein
LLAADMQGVVLMRWLECACVCYLKLLRRSSSVCVLHGQPWVFVVSFLLDISA